jgi:ATP phosphoribosyltransferase regulatory subunit
MLDTPSLRLPAGMRDFAPRAAAARRRIAESLLSVFESWGFSRVITPAFEYEDVLGLGLGRDGRAAALKFVEPSSGRVVALRPDITPQIARLIATRFHDEPGPVRLCYEGTVLRLEKGARSQRELIQAGVELAGVRSPDGDGEMIALGVAALSAAGLGDPDFELTVDLGHLGLMREILSALGLSETAGAAVRAAVAKRDRTALDEAFAEIDAQPDQHPAQPSRRVGRVGAASRLAVRRFLEDLPELSGEPAVLAKAERQAPTANIRRAIVELRAIVAAVLARQVRVRLHVDLAEVRGFDYYTGLRFQGFVVGSAEPVLQGGRYDDLLGRYGQPRPAVGFAVDVESAAAALDSMVATRASTGGVAKPQDAADDESVANGPVLILGDINSAAALAAELRAQGRRAAPLMVTLSDTEIEDYATRWGYREIVDSGTSKPAVRSRPSKKSRKK